MDNTIALILLRAAHRSAMLFLREGVQPAIRVLEERQETVAWQDDGRRSLLQGSTIELAGGSTGSDSLIR